MSLFTGLAKQKRLRCAAKTNCEPLNQIDRVVIALSPKGKTGTVPSDYGLSPLPPSPCLQVCLKFRQTAVSGSGRRISKPIQPICLVARWHGDGEKPCHQDQTKHAHTRSLLPSIASNSMAVSGLVFDIGFLSCCDPLVVKSCDGSLHRHKGQKKSMLPTQQIADDLANYVAKSRCKFGQVRLLFEVMQHDSTSYTDFEIIWQRFSLKWFRQPANEPNDSTKFVIAHQGSG